MTLEPSMKRFLACVATVIAVCLPVSVFAQGDNSAGRVRLSDDQAPPPPIPHVIGSDDTAGRITVDDGGPAALPMPSQQYSEYIGAGPGGVGYQMSNNVFTVQYRLNRRFGGLYGYDDGFTDIGVFIPQIVDDNTIFFYDMRGFVTDNRDGGFNFGVGRRTYNPQADRVWSNSLWLDYDGGHVEQYLRGGYSGSMTSRYIRYRWNGYWILGDQNNFISSSFGDAPTYAGSSLQLARTRTREVAYSGFDATVGGPIPLLGRFGLNWDFGLYYNGAEFGKDGVGFLAKADAQLTEDVSLGVSYSDDAVFGANAQMNLAINFPDGRSRSILRQPRVHDYMLRSDDRNYRVATERYLVEDSLALQCEGTGNDISIAHIIPDATDGATPSGDGTIENPFNSLAAWEQLSDAEKSAYHIVLVRPGTDVTIEGGTYQANLNTGITIGENQRLLASTGRLVRSVENDADVFRYAAHTVNADVAGFANGLTYALPDTDALAGTIFDPTTDPRPILSNQVTQAQMALDPIGTMYNVVSIDENIIGPCPIPLEVSGFTIDGWNPYTDGIPDNDTELPGAATEPVMYNNGIVTLTDVSSFDINSNFILNAVHGIDINSNVDGTGYTIGGEAIGSIDINQIEGAGFYSNSGIDVDHQAGTLNLNVQDNVVYHVYGEDLDNDGNADVVNNPLGTEDLNGNGKLDPGEDTNGDGLLSVNEDNDKDGVISSDDHGIAINIAANGGIINSNIADVTNLDGSITPGYNISRNTTWVDEAELGRDVNGYVNRNNVNTADTLDIIGNRSGINLEANNGATFNAAVADNDTSNNNPWSDVDAAGNYVPPAKNQDLVAIPDPRIPQLPFVPNPNGDGSVGDPTDPIFSNGFGFRAEADGAGSTMTLASPDRHISNNNFGTGAILSARNGGFLNMVGPMIGEVILNDDGLITDVVAPSEYNNNGLNGLLITGDGAGSSLAVQVGVPLANFIEDDALTVGVNEAENVDDIFERVLNEFNGNGQHFISGVADDAFENGSGIVISLKNDAAIVQNSNGFSSGIFHAQSNSNQGNGLLLDLGNDTNGVLMQNFTIDNSDFSGNAVDGISISAENLNAYAGPEMDLPNGIGALHNLSITNNTISAFGTNGINFQTVNSDLTNLLIEGNTITSDQVSPDIESLFDIDLVFGAGFSASQIAIIQSAADRWSEAIIGDLPDVVFNGNTIDDIQIAMDVGAIDGSSNVLALGGFSFANIRNDATELPFLSGVTYDVADLNNMETNGILFDVALHEMGHALGFLSQFMQRPSQDHIAFQSATDPIFTGTGATAEHNNLFGVTEAGVPMQSNGNNVAGGHWREGVYLNEIMTPSIGGSPNPLSRVTIAAMGDLGYTVNTDAADAFAPSTAPVNGAPITFSEGVVHNTPGVGPITLDTEVDAIVIVEPDVFDIASGESGNGINLSLQNSNLVNAIVSRNEITNVSGDGFRMINPQFRTNSLATRNDPLTPLPNPPPYFDGADNSLHIQLNTITGSGGYGVNMALNQGNQLDAIICVNDISNNALGGINVELEDDAIYRNGVVDTGIVDDPTTSEIEGETSYFFGNTINNNGGIGYHITAEDNSQFTLVGSRPSLSTLNGNQEAGIGIQMSQNAAADIRLDNIEVDGNTDDDAGAGTDVNTDFDGEGIGIVLRGSSQANNVRIGDPVQIDPSTPPARTAVATDIINNLNNGVKIELFGDSQLQSTLISQSNISNNGTNGTGDGVNVVRNQSGVVGDIANVLPAGNAPPATAPDAPSPAFVFRQNTINGNGGDGIDVSALTASLNDEYVALLNDISDNGANGIRIFTQGNAGVLFDVRQNTINDNGANGLLQLTDIINGVQTSGYTGTIVGNQFDSNGADGIDLSGIYGRLNDPTGTTVVGRPVQIGSLFTEDANGNGILDPGEDLDGDGRFDRDRNFITNNGQNGIQLTGSGLTNITNNLIDENGASGINVTDFNTTSITDNLISNSEQHGIEMTANSATGLSIIATAERNAIVDNGRDGVQMVATEPAGNNFNFAPDGVEQIVAQFNQNLIADNGGRGIDTTVRGDGSARVSVTDVIVSGNQEAGIYNLVTASTTQDVEALASENLAQDGSIFGNAYLDFSIDATGPGATQVGGDRGAVVNFGPQNQIFNNNVGDTYDGGGLVFRVGTTGAVNGLGQPWANSNSTNPRVYGGLVASIEDTNTVNNNGVDFWIHTFTSTVDPNTTGGAWTDQNEATRNPANDVFNPTGYQQDPLARIEIAAFNNVSGGSADVFGWSRAFSTGNNQNFAFYNNSEPVFKSRLDSQDNNNDGGADDNGAFDIATRPRNATRLPDRNGYDTYDTDINGVTTKIPGAKMDPQLTIIDNGRNSDNFLYPGMGDSTLRIAAGSDFLLSGFNTVVTDFTDDIFFTQDPGFDGGNDVRDVQYLYEVFP